MRERKNEDLKLLIKCAGITQRDLAEWLGISYGQLNHVLNAPMTDQYVKRVCNALDGITRAKRAKGEGR